MNIIEKRKPLFEFYNAYEDPRFSLTAPLIVDDFRPHCRSNTISSFQFVLFHLAKASMEIPNLRLRYDGDGMYEMEQVKVSYTVLDATQNANFVTVPFVDDIRSFVDVSEKRKKEIEQSKDIKEELTDYSYFFVSALPWLAFTGVQHAYDGKMNSQIPRVSFGKFSFEDGKISIPLNVQCHHGLADGMHVSQFFQRVAENISAALSLA